METQVRIKYTLVIPVYNEENCLYENVHELKDAMQKLQEPFEVIISDDGSTDGTAEIGEILCREISEVRYIRESLNAGRGEALTRGFKEGRGEILGFVDIDLATDLRCLPTLFKSIENGADISTGSRWLKGSTVTRTVYRKMVSAFYNTLVRILFNSQIKDHQCGFKAFRHGPLFELLKDMGMRSDRSWAWDTEILIRAQRRGYKIQEFPVEWRQGKNSKFRLARDARVILPYLFKLKYRLNKSKS